MSGVARCPTLFVQPHEKDFYEMAIVEFGGTLIISEDVFENVGRVEAGDIPC